MSLASWLARNPELEKLIRGTRNPHFPMEGMGKEFQRGILGEHGPVDTLGKMGKAAGGWAAQNAVPLASAGLSGLAAYGLYKTHDERDEESQR